MADVSEELLTNLGLLKRQSTLQKTAIIYEHEHLKSYLVAIKNLCFKFSVDMLSLGIVVLPMISNVRMKLSIPR